MFCQKCGNKNDDDAVQCSVCGEYLKKPEAEYNINVEQQPPVNQRPNVANYLVFAILTTIFCCLPLGIPAIVYASKVDNKLYSGDYAGAVEASKKAKMFCWIAFGLGIGLVVLWVVFVVLIGFAAATAGTIQ